MTATTFFDGKVTLHAGDCIDVMKTLADNSIDSIVTDPPYHLTNNTGSRSPNPGQYTPIGKPKEPRGGFMGKQWDGGDIAFRVELWAEVLRVLKHGGHMVAFSGTRTYHRMACAIEDAGFEIRDQIGWAFGSGFPKSRSVGKAIDLAAGACRGKIPARGGLTNNRLLNDDGWSKIGMEKALALMDSDSPVTEDGARWQGWGTALKPAWEPICLARKPLSESTVAKNVLRWGTGALNIDGCRVATDESTERPMGLLTSKGLPGGGFGAWERLGNRPIIGISGSKLGRWPANLCHDGSDEVLAAFPESVGATSNGSKTQDGHCGTDTFKIHAREQAPGYADSGSAARFFASFPVESAPCTTSHANFAEQHFLLSSERAVSALNHAAEASMQRLALKKISLLEPNMSVSVLQFEEIEMLLTGMILNLERRCLQGPLQEKHFLSSDPVSCVAIRKPIGIITITISLWKSNGYVGVATFDLTETNSEVGERDCAKRLWYSAKADADDRLGSRHPTIKPVDLMQWLVRLVTPKGGVTLDPFAGTGTTGEAAYREGCRAILIEREAEYQADIARRMGLVLSGLDERSREGIKARHGDVHPGPLFGGAPE